MNVFESRYHQLKHTITPTVLKQSIRVNTLRVDEAELIKRLLARKVVLEKIPFTHHGYWVESAPFSIGASFEYLAGFLTPQSSVAQLPVEVLAPKPGERVLDMAAAPGVKTSQLAQYMNNQGELVAVEKSNLRIRGLKANLERLGVTNTIVYNTDAVLTVDWGLSFDKILLDAPCMGNYAQDKDWFEKHYVKEFSRNMATQQGLIRAAILMLKKGGTLVYSTCSLEPEENEFIIDWALKTLPVMCVDTGLTVGVSGLTKAFGKELHRDIAKTRRFWPGVTEGFFIAKLVKR